MREQGEIIVLPGPAVKSERASGCRRAGYAARRELMAAL